jgi:desulfoferrodoxin (superoxide reductase-like protein)
MKRAAVTLLVLFCLGLTGILANKTKVEIKAPAEVKAGTEITVTIQAIHSANSKSHHTDWVYLKINGKEVKRWEYKKDALPPGATFTVEFTYVAGEELKLEAEGHCNIHGSAGPANAVVKVVK